MSIVQASMDDMAYVRNITRTTIKTVYPHYYPKGTVEFFLAHHSDERMTDDISAGCVYLYKDADEHNVGTVTVKGNEITRLFVDPAHQGRGYGRELLNFAEERIAERYDEIVIDASLSAKGIYLRRGYTEIAYHTIAAPSGDYLCYDVMKKVLR